MPAWAWADTDNVTRGGSVSGPRRDTAGLLGDLGTTGRHPAQGALGLSVVAEECKLVVLGLDLGVGGLQGVLQGVEFLGSVLRALSLAGLFYGILGCLLLLYRGLFATGQP